jgi:hypothetical protein
MSEERKKKKKKTARGWHNAKLCASYR